MQHLKITKISVKVPRFLNLVFSIQKYLENRSLNWISLRHKIANSPSTSQILHKISSDLCWIPAHAGPLDCVFICVHSYVHNYVKLCMHVGLGNIPIF